jgi:putative redox protein
MTIKKGYLTQVNGLTFSAKADTNHWIIMDSSIAAGGNGAGSSPKELVLLGLAGCTSADIISILKKKRAKLDKYEVNITAQESDDHPKVFTDIHLEFVFYGIELQPKDIERAIELSETKYCAVSAMLKKAVNISTSYKIIEPESVEAL